MSPAPDVPPQIISRDDALALGLKRYFTGEPCRHGHVAQRMVRLGVPCIACLREWKRNNPSKKQRHRRKNERRRTNPEWILKNRIMNRKATRKRNQRLRFAYRAMREMGVEFVCQGQAEQKQPLVVMRRREARALGLIRYFTGKTCRNGHVSHRRTSDGECLGCRKAYRIRSRKGPWGTPEARREQKRRRHERQTIAYLALKQILQQENTDGCNA